jgi:hypothetical protein
MREAGVSSHTRVCVCVCVCVCAPCRPRISTDAHAHTRAPTGLPRRPMPRMWSGCSSCWPARAQTCRCVRRACACCCAGRSWPHTAQQRLCVPWPAVRGTCLLLGTTHDAPPRHPPQHAHTHTTHTTPNALRAGGAAGQPRLPLPPRRRRHGVVFAAAAAGGRRVVDGSGGGGRARVGAAAARRAA